MNKPGRLRKWAPILESEQPKHNFKVQYRTPNTISSWLSSDAHLSQGPLSRWLAGQLNPFHASCTPPLSTAVRHEVLSNLIQVGLHSGGDVILLTI
jgi:hypothetical protein